MTLLGPYEYRPLEHEDSFRILVIFPSLNSSDPICCTIVHAQLSDHSFEYEAVSYTWGKVTQTQTIYLPRGELHVGQNCYNALRRLRCKDQACQLWMDAICIDQNNLQERASQVRMMDKIYNRASTVVVVLNEPNANSGALFEQLATGDEMISLVGRWVREPPSDAILKLLEDLWQDPWFTRVWVLQEVCAKASVNFISGSTCFSFESLRQLYECYGGPVITKAYCPRAIQWIRRPPETFSTPQFNLWHLLGETRDYLATDPKDRIFALKSLLISSQSEMDHLIDYTDSLEECYIRVAAFLLPVLGLRLLTAVRHPHDKKMPSWIPDWSQNLPIHIMYSVDEDTLDTSDKQKYSIRSALCSSPGTDLELLVTGCCYARIVDRSRVFHFIDVDDAERQMKRLYCSIIPRHGVDPEGMRDDPTVLAHLGSAISDAMLSMESGQLHTCLTRFGTLHMGDRHSFAREEVDSFSNSLQQCRISMMDSGELVIVPEAVQCGDVIVILSGATVACALRPCSDGSWALVSGDCYIFTESFRSSAKPWFFACDDYVACNHDRVEEFRLR